CDSALLVSSTLPRPPRPTLSPLHDALPILNKGLADRLREEHRKTKSAAAQAKREQSALVAVPRAPRVPPGPRPTRSAAPAVAAASARPAPRPAPPTRPPERRAAPPVDDDLTPPPTRNPIAREPSRRTPPESSTIALSDDLQAEIESARGGDDEATAAGEHTAIRSVPEGFRRN